MKVGEFVVGPKHKPAERTAIYDPKSKDLLTDKKEILDATLRYDTESVSEQSPKLYRQVATEQGSRVKLCVFTVGNRTPVSCLHGKCSNL